MIVNEIKEDKEIVVIFLILIGSKIYNVVRGLWVLVKLFSIKFIDFVYLLFLRFLVIVFFMIKK